MDAPSRQLASQARAAFRSGSAREASELLRRWIESDSRSAEPRVLLGLALEKGGDLRGAEDALRQAARLAKGDPAIWFHRSRILARLGERAEAIRALRTAIRLNPRVPEPHYNLGLLLLQDERLNEAIQALERAARLRPGYADAYSALGDAHRRAGRSGEAEACYRRGLEARPGHLGAMNNLATLLASLGRYEEAARLAAELCGHFPEHASLWLNLSELRLRCREPDAALTAVRNARRLLPGDVAIIAQHMRILSILERFDEARDLLREGMALSPREMERALLPRSAAARHQDYVMPPADPRGAFVEYHFAWLRQEDWQDYDELRSRMLHYIREALREGIAIVSPNTPAYLACDEPDLEHRLAVRYAEHVAARIENVYRHQAVARRRERIRIGFASPAFGHYAVDHVSRDLYRLLDRQRFEVFGYSLSRRDDHWRGEIAALFDRFRDLSDVNNEAAAARIHGDRLDILVDLYGYGPEQRPEIFARRPAPIQLCQVGLANTSGAPWIDYRIAADPAMPDWLAAHFSEHIVRVPVTHHVVTGFPESGERPCRADVGLPEEAFVYCCFQRAEKLTPSVLDAWAGVLEAVPEGVLWLLASGERGRSNLLGALRERGIGADRIVFASRATLEAHVARQYLADAFLNTFMYSGFNTAAIALWCGVPVVAWEGRSFATRGAQSALAAAGVEELVAGDNAGYRDTAIRLARDSGFRDSVRRRLSRNQLRQSLFGGERNIRYIERALEAMVQRRREGKSPGPFTVAED